jgi:hypothetical protein
MLAGARGIKVAPLAFVEGDEKIADPAQRNLQRPRLFYRRELESRPMVIAGSPGKPPR